MGVMLSSPRPCNQSGCPLLAVRGTRWCEKHQLANEQKDRERHRHDDEINRMYSREPWLSFRKMMLAQNPMCQRILPSHQCGRVATLIHHIISPRVDRSRFVDPSNVVCLCPGCHPTSEGTPDWKPGRNYVPTVFELPKF